MAATRLPNGCYLSIASPPSRDADSGFTICGWFYVPTFVDYHSTMLLNYATNDVGEGFQFEGTGETAGGFVMDYPPNYTSLGGTYSAGVWYWVADVFTRVAGVTTRRTYITDTAGATPTLISTQTWTVPDASPEYWDIGTARGFPRDLRGSFQFALLFEVALSTAQMEAQSDSNSPVVPAWAFISGTNGDITDSSGNGRTVILTGGPVEISDTEAPLTGGTVSATIAARSAPAVAAISTHVAAPISVAVAARSAPAVAAISAHVAAPISVAVAARSAPAVAAISTHVESPVLLPRVILYGHSVIAGYGISDPAQHIAPQLATLLGARVEDVVELGYSGESSDSLDTNFNARVAPYVDVGRDTIVVYTIAFNSARDGVSSAAILANIWSVASKAVALGCDSLVMTETAAVPAMQPHEDTLLTINAAMRSDWPSHNQGVVDTRQRFYNPLDLIIYQVDGAHPNGTGDGVLADLIYGEVNRWLLGPLYAKTATTASRSAGAVAAITATVQSTVSSIDGSLAATLPALTAAASGHVATSVDGALAATLPALTAAASGLVYQALQLDSTLAAALPALTSSFSGVVAQSVAGDLRASLPALTFAAAGDVAKFDPPVLSSSTGERSPYSARRSLLVAPGDVVSLPQWVRKFDAVPPCAVIARDRANVPVSGALSGPVLKGAALNSCAVVVGGLILLEY